MVIAFFAGLLVGLLALYWTRPKEEARRAIPTEWPLQPRRLVNSRERAVWAWLIKVMFDQQVQIKLPVTRFTAPAKASDAAHWYKMLNGVYCTFTVTTLDGKVVGCIDVPGPSGLSLSNQTLKQGLLTHCGITYWVIDPEQLPGPSKIRAAFLGQHVADLRASDEWESRLRDTAGNLHAAVSRQRERERQTSAHHDSASGPDTTPSDWAQNSFMAPLDSRAGELRPH